MARPRKQGLEYFPHDVDASNDMKIQRLRAAHGNNGYAFYFMLLEDIYATPALELFIGSEAIVRLLCRKISISPKKFREILTTAFEVGLFDKSAYDRSQVLTSDSIKRRASVVLEKRRQMRERYYSKAGVSDAKTGEETQQKPDVSDAETPPETPVSSLVSDAETPPKTGSFCRISGPKEKKREDKEKEKRRSSSPLPPSSPNASRTERTISQKDKDSDDDDDDSIKKLTEEGAEVIKLANQNLSKNGYYLEAANLFRLRQYHDKHGIEWPAVRRAVELAIEAQGGVRYAFRVMDHWLAKGIKTLDQVLLAESLWKSRARDSPVQPNGQSQVTVRTMSEEERRRAEELRKEIEALAAEKAVK